MKCSSSRNSPTLRNTAAAWVDVTRNGGREGGICMAVLTIRRTAQAACIRAFLCKQTPFKNGPRTTPRGGPAGLAPTLLTLTATALTACGGGGSAPNPGPGPNPNPGPTPGPGSAITTRLAACPVVNNSSDPAASACLAGTYSGKTLSGGDCSLAVQANGSYTYTSGALSYTYTPTPQSIRVFGHSSLSGGHQVIWLISDSTSANEARDLDFLARWGSGLTPKLEISATKYLAGGGSVSSTCTLSL